MFKKILLITLITAFIQPLTTEASYFTILLKNGNNIDVNNYWNIDSKICFYTDEGKVEIPKIIVRNISTSEGSLEPTIGFYPTDEYFDQLAQTEDKEELLSTEPEEAPSLKDSDIKNDIKDRLSIMEINIDNLKKNKIIYKTQKQKLIDKKTKYEKRIEQYRKDTYTDPNIIGRNIQTLSDKLIKVEEKIQPIEEKIIQTENLLEKQQSMRQRLEKQLASK